MGVPVVDERLECARVVRWNWFVLGLCHKFDRSAADRNRSSESIVGTVSPALSSLS